MQTAKKQACAAPTTDAPSETPVRLADAAYAAITSPAADLQAQLDEAFGPDSGGEERWSLRRTASLLIMTCGAFWACVTLAVIRAV